MKIMFDLNVLVDVLQRREPFLLESAKICDAAKKDRCQGILPSHAVTTLYYIARRCSGKVDAEKSLEWLLSTFEIAPCDKAVFLLANALGFSDFEDAVVAASAATSTCDYIVTRNIGDFRKSPVLAITPSEALRRVTTK